MVRYDGQLIRLALVLLAAMFSGCAGFTWGTDATGSADVDVTGVSLHGMTAASQSLLQQSRSQQAVGEYAQAAASLERAIRIDSVHPALWIELGRVRLYEGDYRQAEQVGRKAQSLAAGNPAAESASLQLVVDALRSQGRYMEARQLAYGDY